MSKKYQQYQQTFQKVADLEGAQSILGWDKEVNMPPAGEATRARQLATLAGISHDLVTTKELGDLLVELSEDGADLSKEERRNIKLSLKEYRKQAKYSREFVERRSKVGSATYVAWIKARKENRSEEYLEALDKMVQLKREEADILGYEAHPYDALLDLFEPEMTVAQLDPLFTDVRQQMVDFVAQLRQKPQVEDAFLKQLFPSADQWSFGLEILRGMGYDFEAGRQDISPHPFTTSFGPGDIRVTTRVDENNFANMCWSCIHEGGHALYEQGLSSAHYGLPLGQSTSLGIHESQSRLWENNVGRGKTFWQHWYPRLQQQFPTQLSGLDLDQFYRGINRIEPSLIRTESDELHYHFHILIRYEIEKQLIEGSLETAQLPELWAEKYGEYLGLEIPDQKRGLLQDIHWAYGSFGYFPTYSLGSFYAAQFYQQAEQDIPNLDQQLAQGQTQSLLDWLRQNIHRHGQFYSASDLCQLVTGQKLNFRFFKEYAEKKYGEIYS